MNYCSVRSRVQKSALLWSQIFIALYFNWQWGLFYIFWKDVKNFGYDGSMGRAYTFNIFITPVIKGYGWSSRILVTNGTIWFVVYFLDPYNKYSFLTLKWEQFSISTIFNHTYLIFNIFIFIIIHLYPKPFRS